MARRYHVIVSSTRHPGAIASTRTSACGRSGLDVIDASSATFVYPKTVCATCARMIATSIERMALAARVADGYCEIHGSELYETNPADPENGPSVHDTENVLACVDCDNEEQHAFWSSLCVVHHVRMLDCVPCTIAWYHDEPRG